MEAESGSRGYLVPRLVTVTHAAEWADYGNGLKFIFPVSGVGYCVCGPATERIGQGDVLVLNGTPGSRVGAPGRQPVAFWCFETRFEHLFPLFASSELSLLQHVINVFKGARVYPASSMLAAECHRLIRGLNVESSLSQRTQLLKVVATVFSSEFQKIQRERQGCVPVQPQLAQGLQPVSVAEILNLSIRELAARFCCSRRHLNRLFHRHFGASVSALRMEMRLLKAASLLRNPAAKVINVAEEAGFNHLGLFNTCFKRRFGLSPGQWRKAALQGEVSPDGPIELSTTCSMRSSGLCPWLEKPVNGPPKLAVAGATVQARSSGKNWNSPGPEVKCGLGVVAMQKEVSPEARAPGRQRGGEGA